MTDTPDPSGTPTVELSSISGKPQIGPYRILQKVGEGGMGEVYEAEQEKPIRRRVALKVIKAGMDSKQVIARFEAERQALAMMDHPAVAKVFDAGITPKGQPYFAMEFIQGAPITEYCDRQRLTTGERIRLFNQVCEGVQHAHQKAIIHRDLKPSNVLVATQDGKRLPKIIDFGVAKATTQKLTERTLFTELGALIGTPEYMSPEQAEMTGENVDTRTDVYSLGVMLYELLVGALPFDSKDLREAGFDGLRRKIREEEPSRPSTRVTTLGAKVSLATARFRRTTPPALRKELSGDLDWITMRTLEKDRTRRYGSPAELAADLERHLNHQPVLASPPSTVYRATKFARRHRVGVTITLVAFLLVLGFAARERIQANRIVREQGRASQEAETAKQISDFLLGLFEVSDPSEARGNSVTAREMLDKGAERIRTELADQPLVQARLMSTMGTVYRKLGLYDQTGPLLEEALATRREFLGEEHIDTIDSMSRLGNLYFVLSRYDEAEPLYIEVRKVRRRVLGEDHYETLGSLYNLGILYKAQQRYEEAESLLREALESMRRALGDEAPGTLYPMNSLANLYSFLRRYDEAEPLHIEVLEVRRRVLGDDHPDTLGSMQNLAILYRMQGRYEDSEQLFLETVEAQRRVLGDEHPDTIGTRASLVLLHWDQGHYEEAERINREVLALERQVLGERHLRTLNSMISLASIVAEQGRYEEADQMERELDAAVPSTQDLLSLWKHAAERETDHRAKNSYAWTLLTCEPRNLRDPQEALQFALEANERTGFKNWRYLDTLALAYHRTGDSRKALEQQANALAMLQEEASDARPGLEQRKEEYEAALKNGHE